MTSISFSCDVCSSDPLIPLGFEVWIDDVKQVDIEHLKEATAISAEITDDEGEHELRLVLKNKTANDTKIDEQGNIISDAVLDITNVCFDGIPLGHMFSVQSQYNHDYNGTGQPVQEKFYGHMGCNGAVTLKFSTPIYLWLLEHM